MLIQPITTGNDYKIAPLRFRGAEKMAVKPMQPVTDTFVKTTKVAATIIRPNIPTDVIIKNIGDIKNYLKANADKIENGKIFNIPITPSGNTLLHEFVSIPMTEENEDSYLAMIHRISYYPDIDYNQKDNMGISFIEKVIYSENENLLSLIKDKNIHFDFGMYKELEKVENSEFKTKFLNSSIAENTDKAANAIIKKYSDDNYHLEYHIYNEEEVKTLREVIKYKNDKTKNSVEEREQFLKDIFPIVRNCLGTVWDIEDSTVDFESLNKGFNNLYSIANADKSLLKELLIDSFVVHRGSRKIPSLHFGNLWTLYKDAPNDLFDIMVAIKHVTTRGNGVYYLAIGKLREILSDEKRKELDNKLRLDSFTFVEENVSKLAEKEAECKKG